MNIVAVKFELVDEEQPQFKGMFSIEVASMEGGKPLSYAVRIKPHSECLSTTGRWEHEPAPIKITDEYKATHRFPSYESARVALVAAYRAYRE